MRLLFFLIFFFFLIIRLLSLPAWFLVGIIVIGLCLLVLRTDLAPLTFSTENGEGRKLAATREGVKETESGIDSHTRWDCACTTYDVLVCKQWISLPKCCYATAQPCIVGVKGESPPLRPACCFLPVIRLKLSSLQPDCRSVCQRGPLLHLGDPPGLRSTQSGIWDCSNTVQKLPCKRECIPLWVFQRNTGRGGVGSYLFPCSLPLRKTLGAGAPRGLAVSWD